MYKVKTLKDKETARKIGEFLTSEYTFDQTWAPNEKAMVIRAPLDSLRNKKHQYWYVEEGGKIIGAMGVRENKYGSGGFEIESDYMAVHKQFRRRGIATKMLIAMERFVRQNDGRYIHILSCDIAAYIPALKFYENNGYIKIAEMPNYYVVGEGRIDYLKEL
jgi:ribosomal protein S18 acetylase RimI-like enzyme